MINGFKNAVKLCCVTGLALFIISCETTPKDHNWNDTVKMVSSGVVSIQYDVPVSFDGKWNQSSYATGFIVDAKQGIILTNRHVVTPGPTTAKAILINNEEIELTPLYFDPLHDFGFFSYNPDDIKHITPHEFSLKPESTHVGQEIRIIGNDAGQKLAILDGTISRLDRDAPNYGKGTYNDFNTFYIQAATSSTGGSSGSPVVNVNGDVVALNAGSQTKSANAFFLPLHFVKASLEKLRVAKTINRGTVLTTLKYTPYVELSRLGFPSEMETEYRTSSPSLKGLLVIKSIVPESVAAEKLAVGDILLLANDEKIIDFKLLESILNNNVNQDVRLQLLRQGQLVNVAVPVQDLHTLTPRAYLKFDSSIFHTVSYQQARHFNRPVKGVFVALSGQALKLAGIPNHSIITQVNGNTVDDLDAFMTQLNSIPNEQKVHIRYLQMQNPTVSNYALLEVNRKWFEQVYCQKNIELGYWPCEALSTPEVKKLKLAEVPKNEMDKLSEDPLENVRNAMVYVTSTNPYSIQGKSNDRRGYGTGIIVDREKGWIVVDRSVVPSMLGDVKIIFDNRLEINGKVEYIHPIHNLALISYPTDLVAHINLQQVTLSDQPLKRDDQVLQMGLNYEGVVQYRKTLVDSIRELWLQAYNVPQYLEQNIEGINLVNPNTSFDGILLNENYEVAGLWASFEQAGQNGKGNTATLAGMQTEYIKEIIDLASTDKPLYSLELGITQIAPVMALQRGVPEDWLDRISQVGGENTKLLTIYNIVKDSYSEDVFKRGDILLAVDDQPVASFRTVELLSQKPSVKVTYCREGQILDADITTAQLNGQDISQVFNWAGLYLHAPHRAAQKRGISAEGIYIASYVYGSPATRYNVFAMRRVTEVDGVAIKTTDDFIKAVKGKKHQESVLFKTVDFEDNVDVITLRLDNHYWPFYEVKYQDGKWQTIDHSK